jgi:nucleoid DNA-binding protein
MSINYEPALNKLTTPVTYSARVKPKNTIVLDDLLQAISTSCTLSASDVAATVMNFIAQIQIELLKGNSVNIEGLARFGTSISAKMTSPTVDLPADAVVNVTAQAASGLLKAVRSGASVTRVATPSLAPDLLEVSAYTGSLTTLVAGTVMEIKGARLNFDASHNDEGVFFVKASDGTATRAAIFMNSGSKKLTFIVPSGLPTAGTAVRLEVRARRERSTLLRTGSWPTLLNTATAMKKAA